MKVASLILCSLASSFLVVGCVAEMKRENSDLRNELLKAKQTNLKLQQSVDSLLVLLTELQQTDMYYYHLAVEFRHKKRYNESNQQLRRLIERFPKSSLVAEAKKIIDSNNGDAAQELYERAENNFHTGNYHAAQDDCQEILTRRPSTELVGKAEKLLRKSKLELADRKRN